ncbi:hypothetical protein DNTS_008481, partial [Danionella cerebrum]
MISVHVLGPRANNIVVSGPVEADHPSSRGRSTPYRLGGISCTVQSENGRAL